MAKKRDVIGAFLSALLGFWLSLQLAGVDVVWKVAAILFLITALVVLVQKCILVLQPGRRLLAEIFVFVFALAIAPFVSWLLNPEKPLDVIFREPNFWMLTFIVFAIMASLEVHERI